MKVFIFAKDENMQTTANLSYDQKCWHFGDLTNISHHLKLLSLVQRLRYVHHSEATPISYTFLVADYWSICGNLRKQNIARNIQNVT